MADNLMFLKCKICGKEFCISKYYPIGWFYHKDVKQYNKFLNEHDECCAKLDNVLTGSQAFELVYDNKD
jgi:hypothetical protein